MATPLDQAQQEFNKLYGRNPTAADQGAFEQIGARIVNRQPQDVSRETSPQVRGSETTNPSVLKPGDNIYTQTAVPVVRPVLNPSSSVEQARQNLIDNLGQGTTLPNQEEIRQKQLEQAQALIEATRAVYEQELGRIKQQGTERLQETKSINVGAGLAGSPFRTTSEGRVQDLTNEQVQAREKERQAEIAQILASAEQRATETFREERSFAQQERALKLGEQEAQVNLLEKQQEEARNRTVSTIETLAKGGLSIDEIPPDQYDRLLQQSGLSDFEARALYNINNPAAQADYTVENGKLIGYFFDPATGKPKISSTTIPGLENVQEPKIEQFGGVPYVIGKDENGNIVGNILPGFRQKQEEQKLQTEKVGKSLLQFNPDTNKWDVKFTEPESDETVSDEEFMNKRLTPAEAEKLGLAPGATYADAQKKQVQEKIDATTDVVTLIQSIKNDPALSALTGPIGSKLPSFKTVTGATGDLKKKVDRLTNLLTLENLDLMTGVLSETDIQILRGGGTLIDTSQRKGNFVTELNRLENNALREQYRMLGITDATYEEALERVGGKEKLREIIQENLSELQKQSVGFKSVGSDTNQAVRTDVSDIKDFSKVSTMLGNGTATGIENGSSKWRYGLDLVLEGGKGAPVRTPFGGEVILAKVDGGFGKSVKVRLDNGEVIRLSHLDSINVKPGQRLPAGTFVGTQGNTGSVIKFGKGGTGTHVDVTLYGRDGKPYSSQEVASRLNTKKIG